MYMTHLSPDKNITDYKLCSQTLSGMLGLREVPPVSFFREHIQIEIFLVVQAPGRGFVWQGNITTS